MLKLQSRRNSEAEWDNVYDVVGSPESITKQYAQAASNNRMYGWQKYRIHDTKS